MKRRKIRGRSLGILITALFVVPLSVFAIIYLSGQKKNDFSPAQANIQIQENNDDPEYTAENDFTLTVENGVYVTDKVVAVHDQRTKNDELLRVCLMPMWVDEDGNICANLGSVSDFRSFSLSSDEKSLLVCSGDGNTILTLTLADDWKDSWSFDPADNCFYYSGAITSGRTTAPLLTKVSMTQQVKNAASGCDLQLDVLADAIQTSGNASGQRW